MPLALVEFNATHETAARRFNGRMCAAGAAAEHLLPENARTGEEAGSPVDKRHFIVMDGDEARGGVIVQRQPAWVAGDAHDVWNAQAPLSEGFLNPAYSGVAVFLMKTLQRRNPLVYSVGMGGEQMPYPRLL